VAEDHETTPEGVIFKSKDRAKTYADLYDKDLVEVNGDWLAKNRVANTPPMPTKDGDVVVYHLHQMYRVWAATWDGAQGPDPNVEPITVWNADEAQRVARHWAEETKGRIFQLQNDNKWTISAA
jgi:hypothetical protein